MSRATEGSKRVNLRLSVRWLVKPSGDLAPSLFDTAVSTSHFGCTVCGAAPERKPNWNRSFGSQVSRNMTSNETSTGPAGRVLLVPVTSSVTVSLPRPKALPGSYFGTLMVRLSSAHDSSAKPCRPEPSKLSLSRPPSCTMVRVTGIATA